MSHEECERYEKLLQESPIALTCMGIGGKLSHCVQRPRVTDFNDDRWLTSHAPSTKSAGCSRWERVILRRWKMFRQELSPGHRPCTSICNRDPGRCTGTP